MIYLKLFFEFLKVGLFAIGGGMATIPFLMDMCQNTGWFSELELANMIAVSESTPGPIGVNMATYVGFNTVGILGGFIATLGLVTPSFIIITIIYYFLMKFHEKPIVQFVLKCLRATVIGLIAFAFCQVFRICVLPGNNIDYVSAIVFAVLAFMAIKFKKVHPIVWILLGAIIGLLFL